MKHALMIALAVAGLTSTLSSVSKADGVQVCVDSKGSTYKVDVTGGYAAAGWLDFRGVVHATAKDAVADGTELTKIRLKGNLADISTPEITDLSFALKHAVAVDDEASMADAIEYRDEPRVYETSGVDLLCSSTMTTEEFSHIAR